MQTVVIVGASGVVGSRVLEHLLACEGVGRIVALGRRQLPVQHDKLVSRVVDVQSSTALAREARGDAAIAVCCLGTTMKQAGSKPAFRAVDHDAVVAFGEAARRLGAERFLLVSSTGANPRSRSFYLRTKGEAEEALARMGFSPWCGWPSMTRRIGCASSKASSSMSWVARRQRRRLLSPAPGFVERSWLSLNWMPAAAPSPTVSSR